MKTKRHPDERKWATGRIVWTVIGVALSAAATYFFSHLMSNEADKLGVIAAIFSILAGVLIAVISILADPGMLLDQSWRHSYLSAGEAQRKILRQTDIFIIYAVQLASIFSFMLCPEDAAAYRYLQIGTFFLTALAFCASLSLPYTLKANQESRLKRAIGHLTAGNPNGAGK